MKALTRAGRHGDSEFVGGADVRGGKADGKTGEGSPSITPGENRGWPRFATKIPAPLGRSPLELLLGETC